MCVISDRTFGFLLLSGEVRTSQRVLRCNGKLKSKPSPKSKYPLRVRKAQVQGPKARASPGVETFEGTVSVPRGGQDPWCEGEVGLQQAEGDRVHDPRSLTWLALGSSGVGMA